MRVAIEQAVYAGGARGVGVYLQNLVRALAELPGSEEFLLFGFFFRDFKGKLGQIPRPGDPRFRAALKRWPESLVTRLEWGWGLPVVDRLFCRPEGVSVYHSPATRLPKLSRAAGVMTVHDLVCEVFPEALPPEQRAPWSAFSRAQVARADLIMVDSERTKADLMERFKTPEEKVRRVYLGVDHGTFRPPQDPAAAGALRRRLGLPERYLVSVGPWEKRRNLETGLKALKILVSRPETADCVWALGGNDGESYALGLKRLVSELGLEKSVVWTGYLERADLALLYSGAAAFVYPSWYDGYNMPMLEAMACGAPVAVSTAGVLPELGGGACLLFDPGSAEELADCLRRLLADPALARRLREKGFARARDFQWAETARQVLAVYREAAGRARA